MKLHSMARWFAAACACAVLLPANPVGAQCTPQEIAQIGGGYTHVAYLNATTLIATKSRYLEKVNLSNPAAPTLLSSQNLGTPIGDVELNGTLAYVGYGRSLSVYDVASTPPTPAIGLTLPFGFESIKQVVRTSNRLYVLADKVFIYDISTPVSPSFISSITVTGQAIAAAPNRLYIANHSFGFPSYQSLRIYDTTNATTPVPMGMWELTGTAGTTAALVVNGTRIYAGLGRFLRTFDVSNPNSPALVATAIASNDITSLSIAGSLFAGTTKYDTPATSGLECFSLSNPAAPASISFFNTRGPALDIATGSSRVHVAAGEGGLIVMNVLNPAAPTLLGTRLLAAGRARDILVSGSNSFIASSEVGVWIMNLTTPGSPLLIANAPSNDARSVTVSGTRMFVADGWEGMKLWDISTIGAPVLRGSIDPPGFETLRVGVTGNTAVMCKIQSGGGADIVDVTNLASPVLRSTIDNDDYFFDCALTSGTAYFANSYRGLSIYDISNPAAPVARYLGPEGNTQARAIIKVGNTVYLGVGTGIQIIDVTFPEVPLAIGSISGYPLGGVDEFSLQGTLLYAIAIDGVAVIDLSQPSRPVKILHFERDDFPEGVAIQGSNVLVAENLTGIRVFTTPTSWPPAFREDLADRSACNGGAVQWAANISAIPAPTAYEWRKGGVPLVNGPRPGGSVVIGATTATLRIEGCSLADEGAYTCRVTNTCGSTTSESATFTVCMADDDCDGDVDSDDIIVFFQAWDSGVHIADLDRDGDTDSDDILIFFDAFEAGC